MFEKVSKHAVEKNSVFFFVISCFRFDSSQNQFFLKWQ